MAKNYDRMDRISDLMQRTIATILRDEFKDPRIGWVTVMAVEVSRDLSCAKVYVSIMDETKIEETLKVLNSASGFFRSHFAKTTKLRVVPRPRFVYDESVQRGARIASLLNNSLSETSNKEAPLSDSSNEF